MIPFMITIDPLLLFSSLMIAATPILLAALGELVVEKSGVLNLGVEGMMIIGAICGFAVAVETGSPFLGMIAGLLGGMALSLLFAFLTQVMLANQVASGLALTLFGLGLSALMGQGYVGIKPPETQALEIPFLSKLPYVGETLFQHEWVVYLSIISVPVVWWFLARTRAGLILRAIGEGHDEAHALGYAVLRTRCLAIMFGGMMAGLGGAFISLSRVPQWVEGMTAGTGWIALVIVVFASWLPGRVLLGAYLFGGLTLLQLNLQASGVAIPVEYLSMSPYVVTILVLVVISSRASAAAGKAPRSLGNIFHPSR